MFKYFVYIKLSFFLAVVSISAVNGQMQTKGGQVANTTALKPVAGDSYAIIFGVSNYPGLTPLKYADKDAELFRDFLETPAGGNTRRENIFYRVNENAKAADFNVDAYIWLKRKALKEGDRLYIYFSGHGDAMNEDNYFLLPYDCMPNNDVNNYLATGRIEMYQVKTLFIKPLVRKKVEVFLIVDACRTNDLPGGQEGQSNFVNYVQSIAEQNEGEIIMLSTGAGQSAIESSKIGDGHGLFTWYLVAGLSGGADKEGDAADHDGKVSLAEIASYVKNKVRKEARTQFNIEQSPVFLPPDKDLETVAVVDSGTYANWQLAENMRKQTDGGSDIVAVVNRNPGKKAVTAGSSADTALIKLDNQFIAAIKLRKLLGENSAEAFYNKMKEKWPEQPITGDAKYTLATAFINFGQDKINLFLSGKGVVHIQHMENEFGINKKNAANKNMPEAIAEQIDKMKTLAETGFDKAAVMMEKAVALLQDDPELLDAIYPKLYFLKAASYDRVNNIAGKKLGLALLKKAIKKDSAAAYNYLLMGHLLYDLKNDSCALYFKKAISLAPKWADPENDLANYYSEKKLNKLAIDHYYSAVRLDSLDALAVQNIGVLYANENMPDSSQKYFLKSLSINPCDRYANSNMGSLSAEKMTGNSTSDPYFKLSEKYVKKSLECDSNFARGYLVLAKLFDRVNQQDSSFYYIKRGISRNPNDASLYRMLGDEYFARKDTLNAEIAYKKGVAVDSLDINSYLSLIWLYENAGLNNSRIWNDQKNEFAKTVQYCQKALKVDPSSAYAYCTLGNINVDLTLYDKAVTNYEQAIKIDSAYVDAINGLGNARYYLKDYDKALLNYNKAVRLNPKFALGHSSIGDVYYIKGDYKDAVTWYTKAVGIDSNYKYPYQMLGIIYFNLRDYRNAAAAYQKAFKLDTMNASVCNALGNAYNYLKSYDTAIIYHKKAIALAPLNADSYNDMGVVYDELNKNEEAIIWYKRAIGIDSTHSLPYSNLAFVYKKLKDYDNSIRYYQRAIKLSPANAFLYNSIGGVYKDIKDYKNQIYYFKKALDIDSTKIYHLQDLGFAYIYTNDYADGIVCLQKLLKLFPNDNAGYYNLACGFSLSDNTDMGMKYLKNALEKGFKDYNLLCQDTDIGNLRKLPEFGILIKQYFPEKMK